MIKNVKEKLITLEIEKRAFINGSFVNAIDEATITKVSSADGSDISGLSAGNEKDIDHAVSIANKSYKSGVWRDKEPCEKKKVLFRLADLMKKHREELALLDTLETGRSLKNYYYDSIPKAIRALRYFAEGIDKYYDYAIPPRANASATITREPLGVVGLITPWNDPMVVSIWKIAPALLMGNSIVVKPAEQSSFSILLFAKLSKEAGIPDGVFNVVPGYGEIAGKALALHNEVAGIFFTGSSQVGKLILQYSGQSNMKKVGLECGGKSPFIVSNNCDDLAEAAKVIAKNIFYNQGQICSAPSRVLVHNDSKRELIALLKIESEKYIPQDPFKIESEVGCVVSEKQKNRIDKFIKKGEESGACKITPSQSSTIQYEKGQSVMPTIFYDVDLDAEIVTEEIFGPVLVIISFNSIEEATTIANNSRYGLAASVWTNNIDEAYHVSRILEAGIVHINSYGDDDNSVPFGGVKESGIGSDKSIFAFDEYSNLKTTWFNYKTIF